MTSRKTAGAKTARKIAATAPADKAKSPPLGDLGKVLGKLKLPGIDIAAIVEAQSCRTASKKT